MSFKLSLVISKRIDDKTGREIKRENTERCSKCGGLMPFTGRKLHFDQEGHFICSTHEDC